MTNDTAYGGYGQKVVLMFGSSTSGSGRLWSSHLNRRRSRWAFHRTLPSLAHEKAHPAFGCCSIHLGWNVGPADGSTGSSFGNFKRPLLASLLDTYWDVPG